MRSILGMKIVEDCSAPWWLSPLIVGYDEGEDEGGTEGEGGNAGAEGEGSEGGDDDESKLPDNIKAILKKERDLRAAAEKRARILEKNAQAGKGTKDTGKTGVGDGKTDDGGQGSGQQTDASTQTKMEKLIVGFRNAELKSVVEGLAKDFQDPTDVFAHLDTTAFEFTQDEDDPTNVVFDEVEIRVAIKDLAKRKPYLLKAAGDSQGTGKKPTSGPKFAGRGSGKQTTGLSTQEMASRFPAMRSALRAGSNKTE